MSKTAEKKAEQEAALAKLREGAQRGYAFGGRDTSHDDEGERATEAACFGRQDP